MSYWRLSLTIHGSVQGVNFRWHTREEAQKLGLVGWVKNNPDGTVSILAQGEKLAIEELKTWCQSGPRWARVERVDKERQEIKELEFSHFEIRYN